MHYTIGRAVVNLFCQNPNLYIYILIMLLRFNFTVIQIIHFLFQCFELLIKHSMFSSACVILIKES